jgi:curli biogenesis system outer membrane secretion channel CsgG
MSQVKPRSALLRNGMWGAILGAALLQPAAAMDIKSLLPKFGGPKVDVDVIYPPAMPIKATTLAMGPPEGKCSEALATRLEEAIVGSQTSELVDRQRFNEVLNEHKLQISAAFNRKTAARIGELAGAQALIFLKVDNCKTHQERREIGYGEDVLTGNVDLMLKKEQEKKDQEKQSRESKNDNEPSSQQPAAEKAYALLNSAYAFVNNGSVGGTMRVVDLATGRVLAAQRFEGMSAISNRTGFVTDEQAIDAAEQNAASKLVRMIVPWKETKTMVFFEDQACDLRTASRMLRTKDVEGAAQKSNENLEACKALPRVKPKVLARAYYNLGVMQFIKGDYDVALENLATADRTDNAEMFLEVITEVRKAKQAHAELQKSIGGDKDRSRSTIAKGN